MKMQICSECGKEISENALPRLPRAHPQTPTYISTSINKSP